MATAIMEDVPRYWNLERYPGQYVAVDLKTDQVVVRARARTTWTPGGLRNRCGATVSLGTTAQVDDSRALTADTPHQLVDAIRAAGFRNVVVMRAPMDDEPLFVGPG